MKLPKLPRLWYIFAHRHLCALQWAIEEGGEGSHYPPQEDPTSISNSFLLSHFLIFLCCLPVFTLYFCLFLPCACPPFLLVIVILLFFFTSSLVSLMSHTGVYHSLCPSRPPFSLLSPFVRPSTFIQSPKWICLMGPAFVQPSRASATEMYYMYRSANKNTDKCATLHAHASMHALSSFANRDVPELKDTSRNINIMYLFAE